MMNEDPWKRLAPPSATGVVNACRVDASVAWDFFWARALDGKYLLLLRYSAATVLTGALPRLKEIEVAEYTQSVDEPSVLGFKLLDSTHRDIFYRLCRDIVESCADARTEAEAVEIALARTWRWHHLLRGGSDGRLSIEEQKGLIGELIVLETLLLPNLPANAAVAAWRGPLGAPKDFDIGRLCIEAKACGGAAAPLIMISSEHQLDSSGIDQLFLHVVELDRAAAAAGMSLTDVCTRTRGQIQSADPSAVQTFECLVEASGFKWDDDYAETRWVSGQRRIYRVGGAFPRISAAQIPTGISSVRYGLSLLACEAYRVSEEEVVNAIHGLL